MHEQSFYINSTRSRMSVKKSKMYQNAFEQFKLTQNALNQSINIATRLISNLLNPHHHFHTCITSKNCILGFKISVMEVVEAPTQLKFHISLFQEAKIQEEKLEKWMACVPGYESFWAFSKSKKGYSGKFFISFL